MKKSTAHIPRKWQRWRLCCVQHAQMKDTQPHTPITYTHKHTFCHGRWFINVVVVGAAADVFVVFRHIYFVCVFFVIFLDLFFYYFIIFCSVAVHFIRFVCFRFRCMCVLVFFGVCVFFSRSHSIFSILMLLDLFCVCLLLTHTIRGIPFFMLRMSDFFFFFLKCDMCVNLSVHK